jgi:hypothetical protein
MYARLIGSPSLAILMSLLICLCRYRLTIGLILVTREAAMAPISSAGSLTISATQPPRSQAERSAPAAKIEEAAQQEKQLQRVSDEQGRRSSEQVKATV